MRKVWESIKNMKVYVFQYFVWETINFIRNWSTQDKKLETKIKIFNRFPMPRTMKLIPKRPPQQHEAHNPGGFHGKKHGPVWERYEKDMRNVWDMCHGCEVASRGFVFAIVPTDDHWATNCFFNTLIMCLKQFIYKINMNKNKNLSKPWECMFTNTSYEKQ